MTEIGERRKNNMKKLSASIVIALILISAFAIALPFAPKTKADETFRLDVFTQPPGLVTINGTGVYPDHSYVDLEAPEMIYSPLRYKFVVWNVDGVNQTLGDFDIYVYIDGSNRVATAIYTRQYHLSMATGYESLGVLPWTNNGSWYQTGDGGWFDAGSTAYVGISGLDGGDGVYITPTQWVQFVNFTVAGKNPWPGPQQYYSDPITMTGNLAVAANWKFQYYLYVTYSGYDPGVPGQGWYWKDTVVTLTAPEGPSSPPPPAGQGWWWMFDKWAVEPNVQNVYWDKAVNITMNTNKTATVYYKAMYYLWVDDWPLNATNLYTNSGWYQNCTTKTLTAPDTIPSGTGIRYKFYAWWRDGAGYISTSLTTSVHIDATNLPIHLEACYKLQYYLDVKSSPTGAPTWPNNGTGWYDAGTLVPIAAPDPVVIDTGSRWRFVKWVINPGNYIDFNNVSSAGMIQPFTATAYYNLEYKLKVDDDQGSSYYFEYWIVNNTLVHTSWWYVSDLGAYLPPMPTMVFHHWDIIRPSGTTALAQGQQDWVQVYNPTTLLGHFVNETFVILSGDTYKSAPGAYCTSFDVNVSFANFNSQRNDTSNHPMDLYGAEFIIGWTPGLIEMTGYTAYLNNIWPTGSYILTDKIDNTAGTFSFAAHAINTANGFDGTRVMLTLHFHVIYEPCYEHEQYTWIYWQVVKLANHLDQPIWPENYNNAFYYISAKKPKLTLVPSQTTWTYITEQNRVFTVDVIGENLVKVKDYTVEIQWDPTYLKALNIIWNQTYFKPPYTLQYFIINNPAGYLVASLTLDIDQGSSKVNGTATLFTVQFEVVLDKHYQAWWAPNHPSYKIDIWFDTTVTELSAQCEPFGPDNVIQKYPGSLDLVDADPWYDPYIGDLNFDGHINLDDLMLIRQDWHGVTYDIAWVGVVPYVDIYDSVLVALNLWKGPLDD